MRRVVRRRPGDVVSASHHPVRTWAPVALLVAVLAGSNVMSNRVLADALYVPWSLGAATLTLVIGLQVDGRGVAEVGLRRDRVARGMQVGAVVVGLTVVVYLLAAALPATRDVFDDSRVQGLSLGSVLYRALVRVPLGTVILEEVAFRGVLPAMLAARVGRWTAVAVAAGLFGLWHVLPSTGLGDRNPMVEEAFGGAGTVVLVVAAVAATAAAGVVLWWLRDRSDSLAAPALAHWSTNGLGYLLAYLVG